MAVPTPSYGDEFPPLLASKENMISDTMVLFWKGPFSQWYPSVFVVDGIEYCTAEQWMMAGKARLFGDAEMEAAILAETSPRKQKQLGRGVRGFDDVTWKAHREDIVAEGSYHKYAQNAELRAALLATGDREMVEASPFDKIWGIGLKPSTKAFSKANWKGANLLGKAIGAARARIVAELEADPGAFD